MFVLVFFFASSFLILIRNFLIPLYRPHLRSQTHQCPFRCPLPPRRHHNLRRPTNLLVSLVPLDVKCFLQYNFRLCVWDTDGFRSVSGIILHSLLTPFAIGAHSTAILAKSNDLAAPATALINVKISRLKIP